MANIWFTSDTHFSHKNTLRYCGRPFWTKEQCDEAMIARWNAVVKPEDTVYHLGDVAMHTAPIVRILPRLNGKKILIVGNHDLMYSYFIATRGIKFVDRMRKEYLEAGFAEIHLSGLTVDFAFWDGLVPPIGTAEGRILPPVTVKARLSHFPTKNVEDKYHNDKHEKSRPKDDGTLNICGHVHQNWLKRGNNINVGVDVWDFAPVSLEEVISLHRFGPKNIDAPKKSRIFIWKLYHTTMWRINRVLNLFRKANK